MEPAGGQPPIVYLPGVDGAPYAGDAVLELLPDQTCAQFLYPDSRQGTPKDRKAAKTASRYLPEMAGVLASWLDQRGWPVVDLIGESYGGALAQTFTKMNPQRVRRLAMLASFTRNPKPMVGGVVGPALRFVPKTLMKPPVMVVSRMTLLRGAAKDVRTRFYQRTFAMPFVDIGLRVKALMGFSSRPWIGELGQPALWVWGNREGLVNTEREAEFLKSARPRDRVVFVEGAGHVIPHTHRDVLMLHLRSFLGISRRV